MPVDASEKHHRDVAMTHPGVESAMAFQRRYPADHWLAMTFFMQATNAWRRMPATGGRQGRQGSFTNRDGHHIDAHAAPNYKRDAGHVCRFGGADGQDRE